MFIRLARTETPPFGLVGCQNIQSDVLARAIRVRDNSAIDAIIPITRGSITMNVIVVTAAAALIALSVTEIALAQDPLCGEVLKTKAFDVYDSQTASQVETATFDNMCRTKWTSVADYNKSASSLGSGGSFAEITAFLNISSNDENNSLNQLYDHLCVSKDATLRDHLFAQSHVQISDAAVGAWKACVLNRTGLYAALQLPPDGNSFVIHLHFKGASLSDHLILSGYRTDAGYNCKLGDNDISNFTPSDHQTGDDFSLSCQRTAAASVQVAINTNATDNTIGPFLVPSQEYIDLTRQVRALQVTIGDFASRLQSANDTLNSRLTQMSKNLLVWDKDPQYKPPLGQSPDNAGYNSAAGTAGPPHPALSCDDGFYVVGVYLDRQPGGLNDVRIICRKINSGQ